ncbi:MAG: SH3 domain-containing protein [Rhizobiaceae bacterium]|nr:SH3 domain-containing protein [Rhizobiaceae bacterium]
MGRFARILTVTAAALVGLGATPATASPGFDFVCPASTDIKQISFSEDWQTAFVDLASGPVEIAATGRPLQVGEFEFEGSGLSFRGFLPEGTLFRESGQGTQCHQSKESQQALALYGNDAPGIWPAHRAAGKGSANIRAKPDATSKRVASLPMQSDVTILRNSGAFSDGFFWFEIEYAPGKTGFMWGALLCTDDEAQDLQATLRRC